MHPTGLRAAQLERFLFFLLLTIILASANNLRRSASQSEACRNRPFEAGNRTSYCFPGREASTHYITFVHNPPSS
jgi:hypothetical protein